MTFSSNHYVPILLTRRGERRGLKDLDATVQPHLTPLFVVHPVDYDYDTGSPKKSTDAHIRGLGEQLAATWTHRAFVDPTFVDDVDRMSDGSHPLDFLIRESNTGGGNLIPCVSVRRDSAYRTAVASIHNRDRRGACIRLGTSEWPSAVGTSAIDDLLKDINLPATEVDLVLDVADEVTASSNLPATAVGAELAALPHLADWRSLTVAAGGYPAVHSNLARGISVVGRADWDTYRKVISLPTLTRLPTFGDYGIAHPDPNLSSVDPRFMQISALFRYTVVDAWLLAKGNLFKAIGGNSGGGAAMIPVAASLASDPRFAGTSHCAGDVWLDSQSIPGATGGNPEAWRRAGTTHHLTQLVSEIAILFAPSSGAAPGPAGQQ